MNLHELQVQLIQQRKQLADLTLVVDQLTKNSDALYYQFKAYGAATADAFVQVEARLKALEPVPHPEPDESAVPV